MSTTTRRTLLISGLGAAIAANRSLGQVRIVERDYSRCAPDFLGRLAADAYARRNARLAKLTGPAAIREYQAWARKTFLRLIAGLPERSPLQSQTVGSLDRPAYRVEKLVYESRPGILVTANLYVPKRGAPPFPGVLLQMGHSANGKTYGPYQRCCQALAQLGYMVLAFDPMGQGERTNFPKAGGWLTRLPSTDDEHTVPGRQMLLLGETATSLQLWDAVRSLDVLAADPRVDPHRLASTGQSGGGTLTMMLAAVDDRLAAAAVSCGNTENFATMPFHAPGSTDDAEQNFIGSGPLAFDRWDLLWPFAGKPLLVAASAHDFAGVYSSSYLESGREQYSKLAKAYAVLGAPDRLRWLETPLPHGFTYPLRMAVYSWFETHLKPTPGAIEDEPPTNPETDETLWCGKTGNIVRDFGKRSLPAIVADRTAARVTPNDPVDLRALLQMDLPGAAPKLEVLSRTRFIGCEVLGAEVKTAADVWVPARLYLPKGGFANLILALEPGGRNREWNETGLWAQLAEAGIAVCAADVRCMGDMEPRFSPGAAPYAREHQSEENYAWASLIFGRSLLGQRVTDIIALVRALAGAYANARIVLAARDALTVPALCAAALEPAIATTYLSRHLATWRSLALEPEYSHPLANFLPDVLRKTDLPQIARSIAPRQVIVAGAVDARNRPATTAGTLYSSYRTEPAWDFDSLRALSR